MFHLSFQDLRFLQYNKSTMLLISYVICQANICSSRLDPEREGVIEKGKSVQLYMCQGHQCRTDRDRKSISIVMVAKRGRQSRTTYSSRSPGVCRSLGAYACSLSTHDGAAHDAAEDEIPYLF